MGTSYYRSTLTSQMQEAYDIIIQGLKQYKTNISLPPMSSSAIFHAYRAIQLDRPELFFLGDVARTYHSILKAELKVTFTYPFQEASQLLSRLNRRAAELAARCASMPPYERAIYLHDCLISSVTYSEQINTRREAHTIVGPFVHHQAVCEGYAKTYKFLCDKAGIPCIVVTGTGVNEQGIEEPHAWNMVKIGQEYFHVDTTFDHYIDNQYCSRKYLFLSTAEALTNHTPDTGFPIPHCPTSRLPLPRVKDTDELILLIRQDSKKHLTHSEYALTAYVDPHAFTNSLYNKMMVKHPLVYNKIESAFFSQQKKVNVIGIKWR